MPNEYEITFVVQRVKHEHVPHTLRVLEEADLTLRKDGTDIATYYSVERDRDGVERWPDFIDCEGEVVRESPPL